MNVKTKLAAIVLVVGATFSLSGCGSEKVNHAEAACDAYDKVVESMNGSDMDALISDNAILVSTLAVWLSEGGDSDELYTKLAGFGSSLQGFIMDGSPESAKTYTDYQAAESDSIDSLCSAARS